jgi:hypothetical protein
LLQECTVRNAIANDSPGQYLSQPSDMDGVDLVALAQRESTPLHVYSASLIRERIVALKTALADLDALVCFAVKANPNIAVLQLMAQHGLGADIVSAGELRRALRAGIPAGRIVFSVSARLWRKSTKRLLPGSCVSTSSLATSWKACSASRSDAAQSRARRCASILTWMPARTRKSPPARPKTSLA